MTRTPSDPTDSGENFKRRARGRTTTQHMAKAYREMAANKDREAHAQEWLDGVAAPLDDEPETA
jgi:hypothetical protein